MSREVSIEGEKMPLVHFAQGLQILEVQLQMLQQILEVKAKT